MRVNYVYSPHAKPVEFSELPEGAFFRLLDDPVVRVKVGRHNCATIKGCVLMSLNRPAGSDCGLIDEETKVIKLAQIDIIGHER
tara:strand:+ start:10188 stop:10439 length:252 start_codon:yes stop_codon:yes gene_type:complete